jgi:macrolide-specific efflux system membrane fusion protein
VALRSGKGRGAPANGRPARCCALLGAAAAVILGTHAVGAGGAGRSEGTVVLPRCRVTLIEDVEVPAQEAGQLVSVEAREGLLVEADTVLAQIDDRQPQHVRTVAELERKAADEEATNDVRVRYAKAAAAVAKAEYTQVQEANRRHRDTVPAADERRKLLAWNSAELQVEQSQFEQRLAGLKVEVKAAESAAADTAIERRRIRAPLTGLVVEVLRHRGEWVQPGEPVLRIVRIDRLRVEGFVDAAEVGPEEVGHRAVTVRVELPRGTVEFSGKVVFVSPLVEAGQYLVRAEVVNRAEEEQWLLQPGLTAEMTIEAEGTPVPTAGRSRTRE